MKYFAFARNLLIARGVNYWSLNHAIGDTNKVAGAVRKVIMLDENLKSHVENSTFWYNILQPASARNILASVGKCPPNIGHPLLRPVQ
jgi:hypothetical protein